MRRAAIAAGLALLTVACGDGGAQKLSGPKQVTNAQKPQAGSVRGRIDCSPKGTVGYAQIDYIGSDGFTHGHFNVYCTKNDPLAPPSDDTSGWVDAQIPSGFDLARYSVVFSIYEGFVDMNNFIQHQVCGPVDLNAPTGTLSCSGATTLSAVVTVR
jgi:hypothetical protein